ncbi:MAG TPA: homoserine kinase [Acidobacteriota bacterium]|jgi:homoserine kinase
MNRIEGKEISVPASIANLGPGFDTLAVAVNLYLRVRVMRSVRDGKGTLDFRFLQGPLPGANYIERALAHWTGAAPADRPSLILEVDSEIPLQAGLGSSAAATVAGLKLAEALYGERSPRELLDEACRLEGHPDNASAAVLGGLTGSCQRDDGQVVAVRFAWPEKLRFVVVTPDVRLKTSEARQVLPAHLSRSDGIHNLQRVVMFLHSLQSGQHHNLREAMRDRWHQPYRQPLVPGLREAMELDHPDLLGVCLAGAGPSIVAIAEKNFGEIGELLTRAHRRLGIAFTVRTLSAHVNEAVRDRTGLPSPSSALRER